MQKQGNKMLIMDIIELSPVMKRHRRASHVGRFTLWNNGRRATQLGRPSENRFTLKLMLKGLFFSAAVCTGVPLKQLRQVLWSKMQLLYCAESNFKTASENFYA